jgi:hypothetical protein
LLLRKLAHEEIRAGGEPASMLAKGACHGR